MNAVSIAAGATKYAYTEGMRSAGHRNVQSRGFQPDVSGPGLWSRLLDGSRSWGSYDATVSRYGVRRYQLILYPPGCSTSDRRLARLWRGWPLTGAALVLIALMLLGDAAAEPITVLAVAVAAYVSIGVLLFLRAGPVRVRVRSMSAILMPGIADECEVGKYIEWKALVHKLNRSDRMLAMGAISPVEHEATWWQAYDRLEARSHV
jgi:hypothetical protein